MPHRLLVRSRVMTGKKRFAVAPAFGIPTPPVIIVSAITTDALIITAAISAIANFIGHNYRIYP